MGAPRRHDAPGGPEARFPFVALPIVRLPISRVIDQLFEDDLPVEMALHVAGHAFQQEIANVRLVARVRPPCGDDDVLASLQGAVRGRLQQQGAVDGG